MYIMDMAALAWYLMLKKGLSRDRLERLRLELLRFNPEAWPLEEELFREVQSDTWLAGYADDIHFVATNAMETIRAHTLTLI